MAACCGMTTSDIDLFELNEAFASVVLWVEPLTLISHLHFLFIGDKDIVCEEDINMAGLENFFTKKTKMG